MRIVDTRDLAPPEPLQVVLAVLREPARPPIVCMRHRREPCLLFPVLEKLGFAWRVVSRGPELVEVFMWRADDEAALAELERTAFRADG